ncbi:MAG TPA: enoyl-CoA hydratase-related protein [Bacillota bacterium]|nr:enoyl-CoA hydratase-related protein [Bacillota bacterium]HOP69011.1 enoyl-CoA hydratase-related protein [Bacillota bacterium]HPT34070.1 enoyl-CoA hydratase-related protein [Bacillota bacterium]HQD05763.1 enoyl-CoA hydratase-related protein [Bacillota bacterium]
MSDLVQVTREEGLALVTINNPPVNALNRSVMEALDRTFTSLHEDPELRAVIVTGGGEKAFVAGADISEFPALKRKQGEELSYRGQRIFQKIADCPVPVIAAVNGYALGGGLELALACDIRVVAENARLGLPEVTLAILPGYGGTQRLPRTIAPGRAKELIFTGEMIEAAEAFRLGLADHLVPAGEAVKKAREIAAKIIKGSGPLAVRLAKEAVNGGLELGLEEGFKLEASLFGKLCDTEDKDEGARAFLEKRAPQFKGK